MACLAERKFPTSGTSDAGIGVVVSTALNSVSKSDRELASPEMLGAACAREGMVIVKRNATLPKPAKAFS